MRATKTTAADLDAIAKVMDAHHIVELRMGTLFLKRSPPPPQLAESDDSVRARLSRMSPDQIEADLQRRKLSGVG